MTDWPSLKAIWVIWPLIWLCTVTVVTGVTVPRPFTMIGMLPLLAAAVATGIGAPAGPKRPPGALGGPGLKNHARRIRARMAPITTSQRAVRNLRQPVALCCSGGGSNEGLL